MSAAADTIDLMAEKKKRKGPGRPATGRSPSVTIFARVTPDVAQALEDYINSFQYPPKTVAIVTRALKDLLEREGFWPRPAKD